MKSYCKTTRLLLAPVKVVELIAWCQKFS